MNFNLQSQENEHRTQFCNLLEECLTSISEVFPECEKTRALLEKYTNIIKGSDVLEDQLIKQWHTSMKPFYKMAEAHDDNFWKQPLPFFQDINISSKWCDPGFTDESKLYLWEYFDKINYVCRLYNFFPSNVKNYMNSILETYEKKGIDPENMEAKDMEKVFLDIMKNTNHEELMSTLDIQDIQSMMENIQGMMSQENGSAPEMDIFSTMKEMMTKQQNGDGNFDTDMRQYSSQLCNQLPPEVKNQLDEMMQNITNDEEDVKMPPTFNNMFQQMCKMMNKMKSNDGTFSGFDKPGECCENNENLTQEEKDVDFSLNPNDMNQLLSLFQNLSKE